MARSSTIVGDVDGAIFALYIITKIVATTIKRSYILKNVQIRGVFVSIPDVLFVESTFMKLPIASAPDRVTADDLIALAKSAGERLRQIRDTMLEPFPRKQAPTFNSGKLQGICGIDKQRMNYLLTRDLPQGSQASKGQKRTFSLAESIQWVKATSGKGRERPAGQKGKVIAVANFKGGVSKTTTSMVLAQGLTLRHARKVLIIDLDPQGSTTTFFGINPHAEIEGNQTILPLIEGDEEDLKYAVMDTYWENLFLIPSAGELFNAEFLLPAKVHGGDPGFEFWSVLRKGLEPLLDDYDYILIDTAPTLSYLTINALFAADSILVPIIPDMLSFASLVQFWSLVSDLVEGLKATVTQQKKSFDHIDILVSRMVQKPSPMLVRDWISKVYSGYVMPVEIPETALAMASSAQFSTVFDLTDYQGSLSTYLRICEPYERMVDLIDAKNRRLWGINETGATPFKEAPELISATSASSRRSSCCASCNRWSSAAWARASSSHCARGSSSLPIRIWPSWWPRANSARISTTAST